MAVASSPRKTTCAEASKQKKSVRGIPKGNGNCEDAEAECPDLPEILVIPTPFGPFLIPTKGIKCVCTSRWRLLPAGKAQTVGSVGSFRTERSIENAKPGDDCTRDGKQGIESRNTEIDDAAGCQCLCYDPLREPNPEYPGRCTGYFRLPYNTPSGTDIHKGKETSRWNWDSYFVQNRQ
jgi:hypothetical protein